MIWARYFSLNHKNVRRIDHVTFGQIDKYYCAWGVVSCTGNVELGKDIRYLTGKTNLWGIVKTDKLKYKNTPTFFNNILTIQ